MVKYHLYFYIKNFLMKLDVIIFHYNLREVCERFFTANDGSFNSWRFFWDMFQGRVDISGSQVLGWFSLDVNFTDGPSQTDLMVLAKQAATNVGFNLNTFFGFVLIMNTPNGGAQGYPSTPGGAPGPGVFMDCRRVNGYPGPAVPVGAMAQKPLAMKWGMLMA